MEPEISPPKDAWTQVLHPRKGRTHIPKLIITGRKFQFNIAASELLRTGYATIHQAKDFLAFRPSGGSLHSYRVARRGKKNYTKACAIPYNMLEAGIIAGTYTGRWNDELAQLEFKIKTAKTKVVDSGEDLAYS